LLIPIWQMNGGRPIRSYHYFSFHHSNTLFIKF
jgi:hypothetical protein